MSVLSARRAPRRALVCSLALAISAVACDGFNDPPPSPLEGLTYAIATDSTGTLPPPAPLDIAPGHFVGTVLGAPLPGSGNDSLATMPRLVGAVVTAYPVIAGAGAYATVGDARASAVTDASGQFTLPQVPGGEYMLAVEPPAGSAFIGRYVGAFAYAESHEFALWFILERR